MYRRFPKRFLSSAAASNSESVPNGVLRVSKDAKTHLVFGANTDVGKTIVSAGLVRSSLKKTSDEGEVHYIKPLQCGGSDEVFVLDHASSSNQLYAKTLFAWETPASPHTASMIENIPRSDHEVLEALETTLQGISEKANNNTWTWIETAGGVLSPSSASPSNQSPQHTYTPNNDNNNNIGWGWKTQADLYQPLLGVAPVVLVGDGRLGGISATLSSLESLITRGYNVVGMVLLETEYDNITAIREYASRPMRLRAGNGKPLFEDPSVSIASLPQIPPLPETLHAWYDTPQVSETLDAFREHLDHSWEQGVSELENMRSDGRESLWWPFTQHGNVDDDSKVTVIDSASGDNFHVVKDNDNDDNGGLVRMPMMDACASWWTQGLGHGEPSMALAAAAAAGRYGHVIFPDVVHAPALELTKKLIGPQGPGHGWADRVFFSDDGSTAMEVGIKMGMKTYQKWHSDNNHDLVVCAQQDCYHGDTLGVMDVAEPSVFNEGQHPWYEPKGLFLFTPTLGYVDGELFVHLRDGSRVRTEPNRVEDRLGSDLYRAHVRDIRASWEAFHESSSATIGSLVMEPILMGAGGMKFVDPLWQRALVDVARSERVPVVLDEVASGLYRLGVPSCREILGVDPDVASYAKLLTGGLLPMSVTLASEQVFEAFLGDSKSQALLHGHSYTANPIGCVSAIHALETFEAVLGGGASRKEWFHEDQVRELSKLPLVQQTFALGTVLAVTIAPDESGGTGYEAASRTTPMVRALRDKGVYARPLGNVIYIMATPLTSREECSRLCTMLQETIQEFDNF